MPSRTPSTSSFSGSIMTVSTPTADAKLDLEKQSISHEYTPPYSPLPQKGAPMICAQSFIHQIKNNNKFTYGRKPSVLIPYFIAACFSFGTATAKDIQTILITRFFTGFFGAAPVTEVYLVIHGILFIDETYAPVLLVNKARRLRHETGNWALHARHEEWDVRSREMDNKFLKTPFRLLATPIFFLMALYASFVFGIFYLCLGAIPIQFADERGWGPVASQLPFLALLFGTILGGFANILNNKFYIRSFEANNNKPVPEARLPPMMLGSILFPLSLTLSGLFSTHTTSPVPSLLALILLGTGFFTIFQSALNYLIDRFTFTSHSASAVASTTFLRSIFAATFLLFVAPMFHEMGIRNASFLLGDVALLLVPIPWCFWRWGEGNRAGGRWTGKGMEEGVEGEFEG
ncbi:hypothetical protein VTL71DRAFT_5711 [Oculimacula yallundae]|uniref:MFS general substrate transporter n=1 Tax=Oculimacula yallundae TaxID=86028 RepID=A0ABR4BY92_9HELO